MISDYTQSLVTIHTHNHYTALWILFRTTRISTSHLITSLRTLSKAILQIYKAKIELTGCQRWRKLRLVNSQA